MTDLTYSVGTVSIENGATTVTGTGFWNSGNAQEWDHISIDGAAPVDIKSVTDTETLELLLPWAGETKSGVAYSIIKDSVLRFNGASIVQNVMQLVNDLNAEGLYKYVRTGATDPTSEGITADDGQYAFQAATGKLWLMEDGVWTFVGTAKNIVPRGEWDDETTYAVNDVVSLSGSSYMATAASMNQTPPNTDYWMLIASKGDPGAPGSDGADGSDGAAATITIGTVTTVAPGQPATVTNSGTSAAAVLDFEIPEGEPGENGAGTGDVVGPSSSVDGEIALYDSTTGKLLKRASATGLLKATSGVLGTASSGDADSIVSDASDTTKGKVELATSAEVATGTDTARAVTPAGAAAVYSPVKRALNVQSGTSYTLAVSDAGNVVLPFNASPFTLTIPPNSSVAFAVGTQIDIINIGAGKVSLSPGSGVNILSLDSNKSLAGIYASATLLYCDADNWVLAGSLVA
jgi:hypothetical protein